MVENTSRRSATKQRMVDSTAVLLRERGAAAVTVDAVLARSGAPRGSVYHHFPGGRNELIMSALAESADYISAMLERATAEGDARTAVRSLVRFWKRALADSDYRAGCPVVGLAVDSGCEIPGAAEAVRTVLIGWQADLAAVLVADGYPSKRAHRLAALIMSAVEGAIILARAQRDAGPLDEVAAELDLLLAQPSAPVRRGARR